MKATPVKEYLQKFQPGISLYLETAWTERKAQKFEKTQQNYFLKFLEIGAFLSVHAVTK
jgi:hypothetical protein